MGFELLHALENKLSSLKNDLTRYRSDLDVQNKRRNDLDSLIRELSNVCDRKTDDVNDPLNKMINNYDNAINGAPISGTLISDTVSDKEQGRGDGIIGNALTQLRSELRDVDNKISELNGRIRSTESQIVSCEESIKAERRKIANEYRDAYNRAESKMKRAKAAYEADPSNGELERKYRLAFIEREKAKTNYNLYRAWL